MRGVGKGERRAREVHAEVVRAIEEPKRYAGDLAQHAFEAPDQDSLPRR
jgi:hypothetical protein